MGSGKASSCKSQEIDFTMIRNIQGGGARGTQTEMERSDRTAFQC